MVKGNEKKGNQAGQSTPKRPMTKTGYKSSVAGIKNAVFEYGLAKHAAQYVESEETLANHIQRKYTKGGPDIAESIRNGKLLDVVLPPKPVDADEFDKRIWFHKYERASNKKNMLEQTGKRAYALIKGQCSPALITKLEGTPGYENAEKNQNVCDLLELIQGICCQFDVNTQGTHALAQAK